MRVDILGEVFNTVVEGLWNRELVKVFHELGQGFFVIIKHRGPSFLGRIIQGELISPGDVTVNRREVGHDSCVDHCKANDDQS